MTGRLVLHKARTGLTAVLATIVFAGTTLFAQETQSLALSLRLQDIAATAGPSSEFTSVYTQAQVSVLDAERKAGATQKLRHIEYSDNQLVVLGLAADGTEKARIVVADPRLVRAESHIAGDQWESAVIYRRSVDFLVALPDDPSIAIISVLKPRWTGSEWLFDAIAEAGIK